MADPLHTPALNAGDRPLLQPFVTNLDQPIFGLHNLPEVVKGALFSRYSRSEKGLRQILLDEFIKAPESGFSEIVGEASASTEQLIAIQKAEAFYDRVLVGYGDDSVAELGGAHLACEGISNIAAKAIEDARIGLSPLEKSTRYVFFNRKVDGRYLYCREPAIMASRHAALYETTLDRLFDTYSNLVDPVLEWVRSQTPRDDDSSERAYNSATKAKALDLLRGLLPMATLTNVGLFGNGRAFEYLLVKLAASPHGEVQSIGSAMQHELDQLIPSFVKRAKSERGAQYAAYLANNQHNTGAIAHQHLGLMEPAPTEDVELVHFDPDAESKVVAAIFYTQSDLPLEQVQAYSATLSSAELQAIIDTYAGDRASRFHRPGRAFEEAYYTFDILADIGAYRDLHRHRVLTQERQRFTVYHGYVVPPELDASDFATPFCNALDAAAEATQRIEQDLPDAAQYLVPFAYRVRWRMTLNLREIYHLAELRSGRQGHPTYRAIAQAMYRQVQRVHPSLAANMHFVDLQDYSLERLAAEQRLDKKLSDRQPTP
ncbi:MAG: FAD-dependent thymidylate synthase [Cyanobacteria bacterium J06638_20]